MVIIQLAISTTITQVLNNCIKLNIVIIKILVDTFIFIINFVIQREIVFKKKINNADKLSDFNYINEVRYEE